MKTEDSTASGIGFVALLQLLLIGLKLTEYIDWSWLKVLLPVELSVIMVTLGFIIFLIVRRWM